MKRALNKLNEAVLAGVVDTQISAMDRVEQFADHKAKRTSVIVGVLAGIVTYTPAAAYAACDSSTNKSTKGLLSFISSLANFIIALGAGIALLMLAVGAVMIIAGGTPERVRKGMGMIKNVVIGLGVLGCGAFIKVIVTQFVGGAQSGAGTATPGCLDSTTKGLS
jgi:hypothetical protein